MSLSDEDTWVCGHGNRHPNPPPGFSMSCGCPATSGVSIKRHQELSDEDLERASLEDLRVAYRSLREHHVAETIALLARRDDITKRRDDLIARGRQQIEEMQKLIERASVIMQRDEEAIDRLGSENARLSEIVDFMRNHYSPLGGRGCALCVYEEGRFIRPCAIHRWYDELRERQKSVSNAARSDGYMGCSRTHAAPPCEDPACYCEEHAHKADQILPGLGDFIRRGAVGPELWIEINDQILPPLRATREADPADPRTPDRPSDDELIAWANRAGIYQPSMDGTYFRFVLDEIRERRDAEKVFVDLDRQFQNILDCTACDDGGPDGCKEHKPLIRAWRDARSNLCEQARVHRGYLLSLNAPDGGDPR